MNKEKGPRYHQPIMAPRRPNSPGEVAAAIERAAPLEVSDEIYQRGVPIKIPTVPSVNTQRRDYILIVDEKAAGTHGGTFNNGADRTRTLNTIKSDAGSHASLLNNQITLEAGTYEVTIICPAHNVTSHQAFLYSITGAADVLIGSSVRSAETVCSIIKGTFTIAAETVFEVRHRCASSRADHGFGFAANLGRVETYAIFEAYFVEEVEG